MSTRKGLPVPGQDRVLPAGQRPAPLLRFGLPAFAVPRPQSPDRPVVTVSGRVRHPMQQDLRSLMAGLPRREQRGDLHCVTTWTATDLRWAGVGFDVVHKALTDRVRPHPAATWVRFVGLDGYRACLSIADARAGVLLADTLDGDSLTVERGGPVRAVAPAHYAYKSVRGVCAIDFLTAYDPGSAGLLGHRRGRVAHEERSALLPGWVWRRVWRPTIGPIRALYEHNPT